MITTLSTFGAYVANASSSLDKFETVETGIHKIQDLASLMDMQSMPEEKPEPRSEAEILFELKGEATAPEDSILGWAENSMALLKPRQTEMSFASDSDAELWNLYMRYARELRRCGRSMSVPGFAAFCNRLQAIGDHFVETNQSDRFRFQLRIDQDRPHIIASAADSLVQLK